MKPDPKMEQAVAQAAMNLASATLSHAFSIPIPNTTPQLYVSLHEGQPLSAAPTAPAAPAAPSVEPTDAHLWMLWDRLPVKTPIALARVAIKEFATSPAAPSPSQGEALDAARYRWLTEDHPKHETRAAVYEIACKLNVRGKGAIDAAIDAAMRKGA
jgi:hypothetical protein